MQQLERARLLVRIAGILRGEQYESERVQLLAWADELLAGKPAGLNATILRTLRPNSAATLPMSIYRVYRHKRHDATLLDGWRVQLGGKIYPSPSAAAVSVSGHPENGWRTWKYTDPKSGEVRTIDSLRR